ncbi:MAG TPA: SDR family NAD(P)-dependent oxidoreductase [Ktedonobacteraceae bacterium]
MITGSTDGLGKQLALALVSQGVTVLLHGRNQQRLETTLQEIQDATGNRHLETYMADLASLAEVRTLDEPGIRPNSTSPSPTDQRTTDRIIQQVTVEI